MPLRPFSFINTGDTEPNDQNWRVFDEASKTIIYRGANALSFTSPVNSPVITQATFTLYGPIVFYNLFCSVPNNAGWSLATYINMPFPSFQTTTIGVPTSHCGEVYIWNTGGKITTVGFFNNNLPTRLFFAGAYTNVSGGVAEPFIQGFYFRG